MLLYDEVDLGVVLRLSTTSRLYRVNGKSTSVKGKHIFFEDYPTPYRIYVQTEEEFSRCNWFKLER